MATLADRNNNPLNIRDTNIPWQGAGEPNGGFETFSHAEYGVRAAAKNLYTYNERDGLNTVSDIVTKWAPPSENNTDQYIGYVANEMGVGANDDLGSLRGNPHVTNELITAMAKMEGSNVTSDVIARGVALANGVPVDQVKLAERVEDFDGSQYGEGQTFIDQHVERNSIEVPDVKRTIDLTQLDSTVTPNWLSTVDSPTYRWTLYLVNNKIWDNPNLIGNDDAALNNSQAFIIAKQGVESEFSVDNFLSLARITPGQRHGNTTPGVIQFDLFESLGFTFMDKVLTAGKSLGKPANLYSQNFILKLEFLGRDPVTSGSVPFPGVFLYPVKFNQIRSQTGPEGTRYNIIAWSNLKHAQTESITHTDVTVENFTTIQEYASELEASVNQSEIDALGENQLALMPARQIKILFDPNSALGQPKDDDRKIDGNHLRNFNLAVKAWAGTTDVASSNRTGANPHDADTNVITIDRETALGPRIAQDIKNNCPSWDEWVLEATKYGYTPNIVVDLDTSYPQITQNHNLYGNVEPVLITYIIKIHMNKTTFPGSISEGNEKLTDSQYQADRFKTLAIEKSYSYIYTGVNTEVINFQLDVQNLFFVVDQPGSGTFVAGRTSEGKQQFSPAEISDSLFLSDIKQSSVELGYFNPVLGGVAKADSGPEAQVNEYTYSTNSAVARRLQDMAKREYDSLNFTMEIKGDPHWMGNMQATILGKLETPDYSVQDGLITFLQFNPNADKLLQEQVKGEIDPISTGVYKLTSVESRFQNGRFTQQLNGIKDVNSNTALLLPKILELSGE